MRRGGALRHPDRSAPRLGSRFAVGTGHLCQIKFWLMQLIRASSRLPHRAAIATESTCGRAGRRIRRSLCARITAPSIAPATSGRGGRRPASTPLRSPASSGDKPGSTIRKILTSHATSRSRHASSAAASRRTLITSDLHRPARSAWSGGAQTLLERAQSFSPFNSL